MPIPSALFADSSAGKQSKPSSSTTQARPSRQKYASDSLLARQPEFEENLEQSSLAGDKLHYVESRDEFISRVKEEQKRTWLNPNVPGTIEKRDSSPSFAFLIQSGRLPHPPESEASVNAAAGLEIERPRSALHTGDFDQQSRPGTRDGESRDEDSSKNSFKNWLSTSPTTPWFSPTLSATHSSKARGVSPPRGNSERRGHVQGRSRTASQSALSSSFVARQPTSPLATESVADDSDSDDPKQRSLKSSRRHTFSPHLSSLSFQDSNDSQLWTARSAGPPSSYSTPRMVEAASDMELSSVSPRTQRFNPRRLSLSGESTPLHHAPMVGSYEESILRGRMSTLPSKPFDFIAQIGVLGKGNCKAALRCPPHISIPFPAVYYNYAQSRDRVSSFESGPSPYVGHIDLENRLVKSRSQSISPPRSLSPSKADKIPHNDSGSQNGYAANANGHSKRPRRSSEKPRPMKTPRGAYRIPQQGQLQIIIKTVDKTAVKLFLVPYDLSGMTTGQKTFIRQRYYSAGPVIMQSPGGGGPGIDLVSPGKHALRYLIHLHICCTSDRRFYLYRSIRVVFANRVPDDKEYLKTETQLPEPRFSTWKPETETPRHSRQSSYAFPPQSPRARILHSQSDLAWRSVSSLDGITEGQPAWTPTAISREHEVSQSQAKLFETLQAVLAGQTETSTSDQGHLSRTTPLGQPSRASNTRGSKSERSQTLHKPLQEGLLSKQFGELTRSLDKSSDMT